VESELEELRKNKTLLGWMPLLNPTHHDLEQVRAVIEVKISPEREGGFDRMAMRISKFEEVESCYLMSGGYDLLVFVTGKNLRSLPLLFRSAWPLLMECFQLPLTFSSARTRIMVTFSRKSPRIKKNLQSVPRTE